MSKQISCALCPKTFASSSSLSHHKKIHSGIKKYNCKHCNKSFGKSSELERHILIHTREKTHKCTKCDKSFSRDDTLKQHSLIHSGEKPRKCTQYDKSFVQRGVTVKPPDEAQEDAHQGKTSPLQSMRLQSSRIMHAEETQEDAL